MGKAKTIIGFRVSSGSTGTSGGYRRLNIQVMTFVVNDTAEILAETIRHGNTWDVENRVRKAKNVFEATGGTTYYTTTHDEHELTISFQDDPDCRDDWYGMRAETRFNDTCIDLMRKIRKSLDASGAGTRRPAARAVIEALQALKAVPVRYLSESYGDWAEDQDFDLDKAIPLPKPNKIETPAEEPEAVAV